MWKERVHQPQILMSLMGISKSSEKQESIIHRKLLVRWMYLGYRVLVENEWTGNLFQMRIVMGGLTVTLANLQMMAVQAAFSQLQQSLAQYVVLWFFSLVCLFVIVFTCQYVPESRDRDQPEVQAKFERLGKVVRASPWVSPCPSPSATSLRKLHFKTQLFTQ